MTFEMLTGRLPYGAGSFVDIGVAHAEGRLSHADQLPAGLRSVVLQALARRSGRASGHAGGLRRRAAPRFRPT